MTYISYFERPECPRRMMRLEICGSGHGLLTCREYKGNSKTIMKGNYVVTDYMRPHSVRTDRDKTDLCCGMKRLIT
jgi:hypothetical protein